MAGLNASSSVPSVGVVKILIQAVQQFTSLMETSVFFAVAAEGGAKFIYSTGRLKDLFDDGQLKPSPFDINLSETSKSLSSFGASQRRTSENGSLGASSKEDVVVPEKKRTSRDSPAEEDTASSTVVAGTSSSPIPPLMELESSKDSKRTKDKDLNESTSSDSPNKPLTDDTPSKMRTLCIRNLPEDFDCEKIVSDMKQAYGRFDVRSATVSEIKTPSHRRVLIVLGTTAATHQAVKATYNIFRERFNKVYADIRVDHYREYPSHFRRAIVATKDPGSNRDSSSSSHTVEENLETLKKNLSVFGPVVSMEVSESPKSDSTENRKSSSPEKVTIEFDSLTVSTKAMNIYKTHYPSTLFSFRYAAASPTNCVWVGGLPDFVTVENVENFCKSSLVGRVTDVFINRPPGHALIYFETTEEAEEAERALRSDTTLAGNFCQVDFAGRDFQNYFLDGKDGDTDDDGERKCDKVRANRNGSVSSVNASESRISVSSHIRAPKYDRYDDDDDENVYSSESEVEKKGSQSKRGKEQEDEVENKGSQSKRGKEQEDEVERKGSQSKRGKEQEDEVKLGQVLYNKNFKEKFDRSEEMRKRSSNSASAPSSTPIKRKRANGHNKSLPSSNSTSVKYKIFVGNLDVGATEDQLRECFSSYKPINRVEIQSKAKDSSGSGSAVEVFAFVEFDNADAARRAVDEMQGKRLGSKDMILCED